MITLMSRAWRLPSQTGFRQNPPFPHCVIDGFLEPALFASLQAEFPAFDRGRALNERGEPGGKAVYPNVRELGPAYRAFDDVMRDPAFLGELGGITGIDGLLYDADYVGGGCHLNMNGQDLDLHVDFNYHPRTRTHRRLNLILFLNDEWRPEWGGCLELQQDPRSAENFTVEHVPAANRAVIFETSEHSWHGFSRIRMPADRATVGRRSLAVYFYTKTRPAAETAPSHGTFYLNRPLPPRFQQVGHVLTDEDVAELERLVKRRDTMIDHLYRRELDFARVLHSPSVRLAQRATAPLRWLKRRLRGAGA